MIDAVGRVAGPACGPPEDIALSTIFVVLGLGFLAGGAYAVVEGWPYVLIERGFTLVITGTVLMTAGVVLLALSRVMAELRRLRQQMSGAAMAMSVAAMGHVREEREPAASPPSAARPASDADGPRLAPVAIGGAAAAGGLLAAGTALAGPRDVSAGHHAAEGAMRDDEPDLFAVPAPAEIETASGSEPEAARDDDWNPAPWPDAPPATTHEERADAATEPAPAVAPDDFEAALIAATADALAQEQAAPDGRELPADSPAPVFEPSEVRASHSIDEDFDRLRDRLGFGGERAAGDGEAAPALSGERRVTSSSEIAAASDWMTAIRPGRERWLAEPETRPGPSLESEPAPGPEAAADASGDLPVWPPQTREAAPFEPDELRTETFAVSAEAETGESSAATAEPPGLEIGAEREPEPLPTFALLPDREPEFRPDADIPSAQETPVEPEQATEAAPETAEPAAPAASEEGIVGAYQVGTAHFTIYADGSIQARTPDGDYSFASMDELKTYLASEKNRIGA